MTDTPVAPQLFESSPPTPVNRAVAIPFQIVAWTQPGPKDDPDTFESERRTFDLRARSSVPIGYALDLASMVDALPDGTIRVNLVPYNRIMAAVLWDDADRRTYYEVMHDSGLYVDMDTLGALAQWLATRVAGHPTGRPAT